jgi:WD40 repeat protein
MDILVEKIKNYEYNLKKQMETQIQKEKILFELIDKIYENNYKHLKCVKEEDINGYRFYKFFSKINFNFGEFNTEHQEEIIPEIDNLLNEFDKNIATKKFKTSIKYPYFELIKKFNQINDIKQESIISCLAENKNSNELFIGYRDYSINILHPKNLGFETVQTLKYHKGEITSLLYIDEFLVSGSKDRTIKIWKKDNENIYKVKQIIKQDKEIKRLNSYINGLYIGFLATGEENNFRLFLKKEKIEEKEKLVKEKENKNDVFVENEKNNCITDSNNEDIFKIEQVFSDHDNEVVEAIQIRNNNDIISGSKDMTIIIWKDLSNSLQYECNQIISAGNEVEALCPYGNKGFAFALNVSYDIKIYELNLLNMKYENIGILNPELSHDKVINQLILLKDNRIASCSYDSTVKIISYNSLTKELREDQILDEQNLSVNGLIETKNGKLITGGHGKHLIIYKRN